MKYLIIRKKYPKNSYEGDFEIFIKGYKHACARYKDYTDKDIYLTLVYVEENNKYSVEEIEEYVNKKESYKVNIFEFLKNRIDSEYKYGKRKGKNKIITSVIVFFSYIIVNWSRKFDNFLYKNKINFLKLKLRFFKINACPPPVDKSIIENIDLFIESNEDKKEKVFANSINVCTDKEFIINGELWKRNW